MKNAIYILLALLLTGCMQEIVQPDTEYRGDLVLGKVLTTSPVELAAEPLDFNRTIPTDSIIVIKSDRYTDFEPATLDTVQVVLRYKEGIRYYLDSATAID